MTETDISGIAQVDVSERLVLEYVRSPQNTSITAFLCDINISLHFRRVSLCFLMKFPSLTSRSGGLLTSRLKLAVINSLSKKPTISTEEIFGL